MTGLSQWLGEQGVTHHVEWDVWSSAPPKGGDEVAFSIVDVPKAAATSEQMQALVSQWNARCGGNAG